MVNECSVNACLGLCLESESVAFFMPVVTEDKFFTQPGIFITRISSSKDPWPSGFGLGVVWPKRLCNQMIKTCFGQYEGFKLYKTSSFL